MPSDRLHTPLFGFYQTIFDFEKSRARNKLISTTASNTSCLSSNKACFGGIRNEQPKEICNDRCIN
ncbi:hypothetical protein PENTCL1PPCAC_516 [Pristionchus entomophagus]|uniref:Uncharacterized protein n=1 Tax=Pristionchus entomophagus TaxID=358040 RepID=A0AAV5S6E1_9BILA|nr:hypothetical protein PENTCL1PPCAC_516 [Pristionchus entomophagus]